eukprot:TRINITY_DN973_c0_g1_i3.p1 TRINITY_DN973_c0_g1~~TRINITY_DN973_c0_g1_i3.p1  ORF type:complete len:225 (+),score=-6.25 TRINITY_DN973_c0_g1_i3:341-1015(+)
MSESSNVCVYHSSTKKIEDNYYSLHQFEPFVCNQSHYLTYTKKQKPTILCNHQVTTTTTKFQHHQSSQPPPLPLHHCTLQKQFRWDKKKNNYSQSYQFRFKSKFFEPLKICQSHKNNNWKLRQFQVCKQNNTCAVQVVISKVQQQERLLLSLSYNQTFEIQIIKKKQIFLCSGDTQKILIKWQPFFTKNLQEMYHRNVFSFCKQTNSRNQIYSKTSNYEITKIV